MKANIHPTYHMDCQVTCSCGNTFSTGSSLKTITADLCSACHPFYTNEMKFVDTQGRVERFEAMRRKAAAAKKASKSKKDESAKDDQPVKTLKEMMQAVKTA